MTVSNRCSRVLLLLLVLCSLGGGCEEKQKSGVGYPCANSTDCADLICYAGICVSQSPLKNGEPCKNNGYCKSLKCVDGLCIAAGQPNGMTCLYDEECVAGVCTAGVCGASRPPDRGVLHDAMPADVAQPDVFRPDVSQPDAALPDMTSSDTALPDMVLPDTELPDAFQPDACLPGGSCTPSTPCKAGTYICSDGGLVCIENGNVADGTMCGVAKSCQVGICAACGSAKGQPCCSGATCDVNLTCNPGTLTCDCGLPNQACCGGTACSGSYLCAGKMCTCVLAVSGATGSYLVLTDGSVWSWWGYPLQGPVATQTGSTFKSAKLAEGPEQAGCALKTDGTVWCWCSNTTNLHLCNDRGQLGFGNTSTPTKAMTILGQVLVSAGTPLNGVAKIVGGAWGHFCALKNDGTVWCWGDNSYGQLGQGSTTSSSYAVQVQSKSGGPALSGIGEIAAGYMHVCALKTDGSLYCWGTGWSGELGLGAATTESLYPANVSALSKSVAKFDAGSNLSCAVAKDTSLWCWGDNSFGQLGNGTTTGYSYVPVKVQSGSGGQVFTGVGEVHIASSGKGIVAGNGAGQLWYWGDGTNLYPKQVNTVNDAWRFGMLGTVNLWYIRKGDGKLYIWSGATSSGNAVNIKCP